MTKKKKEGNCITVTPHLEQFSRLTAPTKVGKGLAGADAGYTEIKICIARKRIYSCPNLYRATIRSE